MNRSSLTDIKVQTVLLCLLLMTEVNAKNSGIRNRDKSKEEQQPITFTENKGQVCDQNYAPRPDVLYGGTAGALAFHLKRNGISYQLSKVQKWTQVLRNPKDHRVDSPMDSVPDQVSIYRVDVEWLGSNIAANIYPENAQQGYSNFYNQQCPGGVHEVYSYSSVKYDNIYHQINLHFYQKDGQLKYDFIVLPGGDYRKIRLEIKGAEQLNIDKNGSLRIKTPFGEIEEEAPVVYQNGGRIEAMWKLKGNVLSIEIEGASKELPLIIDPGVRAWGTFYGAVWGLGSGGELSYDCATDLNGNVMMAGFCNGSSGTIIATTGAHQAFYAGGGGDGFLVKFNSNGVRQWGTYYGGAGQDWGLSCATDMSGNIYMSGECSSASTLGIASPGAHQTAYGGGTKDAYLVKFSSSGVRQWGTYYGGLGAYPPGGWEWGGYCAADASGNVYLCGTTDVTGTVIATPGSHQPTFGGARDAYLVKFNSAGVRQWGTYYGDGNWPSTVGDTEQGNACFVDGSGNVYMTGSAVGTYSGTVLTTPGTHKPTQGDIQEIYLVKFNSNGVRQWGTFYGGSAYDESFDGCIDPSNNVFITGRTNSPTNSGIATPGAFQTAFVTSTVTSTLPDAFLAKFNNSGILQWGTYYGDSYNDEGLACSTDTQGAIYIAGYTMRPPIGSTMLASPGAHQSANGGGLFDGFLVKFDASGNRDWATYYGGSTSDKSYGCATYSNSVYMSGDTDDTGTVIATPGSHQPIGIGGGDAFLVKFNDCSYANMTNVTPSLNLTRCSGQTTTLNIVSSGTITWYSSPTGTTLVGTGTAFTTPTLSAGTVTFYSQSSNSCGVNLARLPILVSVASTPTIGANSGSICAGESFTFIPSGAATFSVSGGSFLVSPPISTNYTVTGTGTNGCVNSVGAISNVLVVNLPVISAGSGSICPGNTFTIIPSGANTYTFSGGSNIVSPSSTTNYSITGTSAAGCTNTVGAVITITVRLTPTITVNSGNICNGQSFTISPSGANLYTVTGGSFVVSPTVNTSYSVSGSSIEGCLSNQSAISNIIVNQTPTISVSSGSICSGQSFTINPSGASTYTFSGGSAVVSPVSTSSYSIAGTDLNGCVSQTAAISTVTVNPNPIISVSSGSICEGSSFTIVPSGANSYTYSGGSAIVNPLVTTSYSITGTDANGCVSQTPGISSVIVNQNPSVSASSNASLICLGETITLMAVGANSYSWSSGQMGPIIIVTPSATSVYTVLGFDANGCSATASLMQLVEPCVGMEIDYLQKGSTLVYPNPTKGHLTIQLEEQSEKIRIEIIDVLGKLIFSKNEANKKEEIDLSNFANGVYFIQIINSKGLLEIIRLVKE